MKRTAIFILFLLGLSCLSGYLMSKASLIGKIGIDLFYKEYKLLRVWWQGALAVFITLLVLFIIQAIIQKKATKKTATIVHILSIVAAVIGLYFTYLDFRNTNTHRWLGERFHLGAYLFWLGWMATSIFFLTQQKTNIAIEESKNYPPVS